MSGVVPAEFRLVQRHGRIDLVCERDGCDWEPCVEADYQGIHPTELVARAVEHVQEAHR